MKLKKIKSDEFDHIYSELEKNFIPDERRDYNPSKALLELREYDVYHIIKDDKKVGFVTVWHLEEFAFVEHFVIYEKERCLGYGSQALSLIIKEFPKIVLEAEPPVNELCKRRLAFYERNGFYQNDYPYIQPSYRENGNEVSLILMSYPEPLADCDDTVSEIYKRVYRKRK